jgi:M6 family metalloprotease-like protein/uncharacterized repeat protein (TIGR01451 family)
VETRHRLSAFVVVLVVVGLVTSNAVMATYAYAQEGSPPPLGPVGPVTPPSEPPTPPPTQPPNTSSARVEGQPGSQNGWLSVVWGDGPDGASQTILTLTDDNGRTTVLAMSETVARSLGGVLSFDRKYFTVRGIWAAPLGNQSTPTILNVTSLSPAASPGPVAPNAGIQAGVIGSRPWVSIMCKFSDYSAEPRDLTYFQGMYANVRPGLDHYWRELSYDTANVAGSNAAGWFVLPHPEAYYNPGDTDKGTNLSLLATDCIAAADPSVNFATYSGINMMFNSDFDNGWAWGGGRYMTLDGVTKLWSTTWEPPWAYSSISVIAHEMGHGFGLPHSSGAYGQTYDNAWDVMSQDRFNCAAATDPTYGCIAQHTISYYKDLLGWIPSSQKFASTPGSTTTIALEQLALPQTGNYRLGRIPINGSDTYFYTVEARKLIGYDSKLAGAAVIIHEVDTARPIPAHVIDIDGNGITGDAGAMWTLGETFSDIINGIAVTVDSATSTGFVVTIGVRPIAVSGVSITGMAKGLPGKSYSFTASASPIEATLPITYIWQATGQSTVTHTNGTADGVSFSWNSFGVKTITVTAINAAGVVTATSTIDIAALFVSTTGSDAGNLCTSFAAPCATVQHAVDVASPSDEIRVASGTFTGVSARAAITQMVYLSKTVDIRGGYAPTDWLVSYPLTQPTTLDAQGKGRVFYIPNVGQPTIDGLRIANGNASGLGGQWGDSGGGIYVDDFASPTIRQCTILSSTAQTGGGVFLAQSYTTFTGNTVAANSALWCGGGLVVLFSSGDRLDGNTFSSNTSTDGGGVCMYSAGYPAMKALLTNNVIADNRVTSSGSGLLINGGNHRLLHTTIVRNTGGSGVGAYVVGSAIGLTNTLVASQTIGVYAAAGAAVTLQTTLWGAGVWANQSDWAGAGTVTAGAVNPHGDPAFMNSASGDYHIGWPSAAINAAVDAGVTTDIDRELRPHGDGYDIGADEFSSPPALAVSARANPIPAQTGTSLTYTLRVTNTSDVTLHGVVTDVLPAHVSPSGTLTWTAVIPPLGAAWVRQAAVTVDANYTGPLTNVVQVATDEGASGLFAETIPAVGPLTSISIAPNPVTVTVGTTRTFTAAGTDNWGNPIPISPVWATDAGAMTGSTLTARTTPAAGRHVTATVGNVSGTAVANVVAGPLAALSVAPSPVTVTVGTTRTFTAAGMDAWSNSVPISPTWSTDAGSMTGSTLSAQTTLASTRHVTATAGSISGSAVVNLVAGPLATLAVTPNPVTLTVGATRVFTASGLDAFGNAAPTSPAWSTDAGVMTGSTLTAMTTPASGRHITATVGDVEGAAVANITAGPLARLSLTPDAVTLQVRQSQQFGVSGIDAYGNAISNLHVLWLVAPSEVGTIDATGLFTAGTTAGVYPGSVLVSSGSFGSSADVIVRWPYETYLPVVLRPLP